MAASATFALKAGVWFRRARLLIVSPDSRVNLARRQAETPLIPLFRFLRPALSVFATVGARVGGTDAGVDNDHVSVELISQFNEPWSDPSDIIIGQYHNSRP